MSFGARSTSPQSAAAGRNDKRAGFSVGEEPQDIATELGMVLPQEAMRGVQINLDLGAGDEAAQEVSDARW